MTGTTTPPAIDATKEFEAVRSSLPGRVVGAGSGVTGALGRWLGRARILAVVDAGAGNGCRCVSSAPRILADVEPAHARRIADARLREVQAEWTEFEAAAKAPSHSLPSLQRFICGADLRLEELD
jgi:hypothetical protein